MLLSNEFRNLALTGLVAMVCSLSLGVDARTIQAAQRNLGQITFTDLDLRGTEPRLNVLAVLESGGSSSLRARVPVDHCASAILRGEGADLQYQGPADEALSRLVTALSKQEWNESGVMMPSKVRAGHVLKSTVTLFPKKGAAIDDLAAVLAQMDGAGMMIEMERRVGTTSCQVFVFAADGYGISYSLGPS